MRIISKNEILKYFREVDAVVGPGGWQGAESGEQQSGLEASPFALAWRRLLNCGRVGWHAVAGYLVILMHAS